MTAVDREQADYWIATGRKQDGGRRVLGPFLSSHLAQEVRVYVEQVKKRDDLWVVTGDEVPDVG